MEKLTAYLAKSRLRRAAAFPPPSPVLDCQGGAYGVARICRGASEATCGAIGRGESDECDLAEANRRGANKEVLANTAASSPRAIGVAGMTIEKFVDGFEGCDSCAPDLGNLP